MLEALVDEKPIRGVLCGSFSILLSAVIALAPVQAAGAAANSALGDSDIGEFYRIDDVAKKEPGVLLRQEPLEEHQSLNRAGKNVRLLYTSTEGLFGEPTVAVSGALFLPEGTAPKGGWPLLGWAHGTVGIADVCAPSWNGRQSRDVTYLNYWLANGYAIVASDYQGLGTQGTHPYLAARPVAYSNLDIIRAVQKAGFPISDSVVMIGQSQGAQAALSTVGNAPDYAPELDIRGAVATGAPYFSAEGIAAILATRPTNVVDPMLGYNFLALSMLSLIDQEFTLEDYVSDDVLPVAMAVDDTCYAEMKQLVKKKQVTYNKAFKQSPTEPLQKAFKRMEYPSLSVTAPVFMGIGGKDINTPPRMQQALVRDFCAAGSKIEAHYYHTGTHGSIVNGSTEDSSLFVAAAFSGEDIKGNCHNLPF
jgi:pimeloyl-ACP methyl ester carboxylesterase|tara:strand:+ start:5798 stop:7057 length:1260 start_codon:yes stop_codon:yes gene_type:complete